MRNPRVPALLLATVLQLLPIVRTAAVINEIGTPLIAILFRWAALSAAVMGGIDAVSGATTGGNKITSTNSYRGTNGLKLADLKLTTSPEQASLWLAAGLPSGIVVTNKPSWRIAGTPTVGGVFNVTITAVHQLHAPSVDLTKDPFVTQTLVLTILDTGTAPTVTSPPLPKTVNPGQSASFTVLASGSSPLTCYWTKGAETRFVGTTTTGSNTFTIPTVTALDAGLYSVVVSNSVGKTPAVSAQLTVNEPAAIAAPPQTLAVYDGETVSLSVSPTGTPPITLQWFLNDQPIAGGTAATLLVPAAHSTNAGSYKVTAQNVVLTATSAPGVLTVIPLKIDAMTPTPAGYRVDWTSLGNHTYWVETRLAAESGIWTPSNPLPAPPGGGPLSLTLPAPPAGQPQFVRLKALPTPP